MKFQPTGDGAFAIDGSGFADVLERSDAAEARGEWQVAVEMRWEAFQRLVEALPDEAVELDWEDGEAQAAVEVGYRTGLDHFLARDWELAAAIFEQLLEFDPEDHTEATVPLAYCYVAMQEWELFDETVEDISDKSVDKAILNLWSARRRTGNLPDGELHHFRTRFAPCYAEFTATEHHADETYLKDIHSQHPSQEALAREKWLSTEHIWSEFGLFLL